jgi:dTDP-4-dehydrorhamnose reductase
VRYAVLGSSGQLGRELCRRLPGEVVALTRSSVDLSRPETVRAVLPGLRPDVVVNCAAYNFVDRAEAEPHAAFAVNAWGVRELARLCAELGSLLVHFSTDHVFGLDDRRQTPWAETDAPGPVSAYGLSKLAGEYLARALCPRHLVVRTCGLYGFASGGGKGSNFVETVLRLAAEGRPLRVVADQVCTPTSAADVAAAVVALLAKGRPGLYHVTSSGACSWYEFARAVFELAGVSAEVTPITSQEYGAAARRPGYSVLAPAGLALLNLPPLQPWREALADYLRQRQRRAGVE